MNGILFFIGGILIMVVSVMAHEIGHKYILSRWNKNVKTHYRIYPPRIWTGEEHQYTKLTKEQRFSVYFGGIFFGALPILLFGSLLNAYLLLIIPYLFGIEKDIRLCYKNKVKIDAVKD